jgi:hypothetical protein
MYEAKPGVIRPIHGIPGAALLGDSLDPGFAFTSAFVSPAQNFAVVTPEGDSHLRLVEFEAGGVRVKTLDGAISAPDRIVFSPTGRAALLHSNDGRLQMLTGLPHNPVAKDLDSSALAAAPTIMAATDDGALAVLSGGTEGAGPVLLRSDGSASQLALPDSTVSVSFRRNSHDLAAATSSGDVYLVAHPESDPDYRIVYAAAGENADVIAAQFSADGTQILVAASSGALEAIELKTGNSTAVSCACRPSMLEPMQTRNVFRLTGGAGSPVMLLDASGPEPRVWFVPANTR